MTSFLEFLHYADNIHLASHWVLDFGLIALDLKMEASRVGQKINISQVKFFILSGYLALFIFTDGQNIDTVEQSAYLDRIVSAAIPAVLNPP